MSRRSNSDKRARRIAKLARRTPETHIDLVAYLRDRRLAQTAGEARKILTAGRVRVGSHVVGRAEIDTPHGKEWIAMPLISAKHRSEIIVLEASK